MPDYSDCRWFSSECDGSDGLWTGQCPQCGKAVIACDFHYGYHVAFAPELPTCQACDAVSPADPAVY